jgi:phosphatidylserine decarboxylase
VRIFLSIFDVHVQRSPLHGRVAGIERREGPRGNALKADSAERNEAVTLVLHHPTRDEPRAAVRQIVGAVARRIVCSPAEGEILQRGQRYGMILFGSTVDLYLPEDQVAAVELQSGQYVYGGVTVVAELRLPEANVGVKRVSHGGEVGTVETTEDG